MWLIGENNGFKKVPNKSGNIGWQHGTQCIVSARQVSMDGDNVGSKGSSKGVRRGGRGEVFIKAVGAAAEMGTGCGYRGSNRQGAALAVATGVATGEHPSLEKLELPEGLRG